jgi:RNA polymerase sigma-70 factor (ECF subfamily)
VSKTLQPYQNAAGDEDSVLIARFLAGEDDVFATLYQRYYDKVFSIARGILLSPEDAADAVQEIFTLVYRNLNRFDRRSRFSTWLFRVAVNRSIQEARRMRRHRHTELTETLAQTEIEDESADPRVSVALSHLSPGDRAVLALFYWEEFSLTDIGASLGCAPNAAKTRLYRARERFRASYEEISGE